MKFRFSVQKSTIIDLAETDPHTSDWAWAHDILNSIRNETPVEETPPNSLDKVDIDTLTGAFLSVLDSDIDVALEDFAFELNDFKVEVLGKPKVYTASKVFRAPMWKNLRSNYDSKFEFTSRWIDQEVLDDNNNAACKEGWIKNIQDVNRSDFLICYAEAGDPLSGTLVEIGAMLAKGGRVFLLGTYDWKTWKHHPNVSIHDIGHSVFTPEAMVAAVLDYISIHGLS